MTKNYFQKFEPYHFSTNQKKGFYFLEQADEYSFEKNSQAQPVRNNHCNQD